MLLGVLIKLTIVTTACGTANAKHFASFFYTLTYVRVIFQGH